MPGRAPADSANMTGREPRSAGMSGFAEYERYDASGLAELVRRRQVSPRELLEAAIERVESRNGAVNAVTMRLDDYGRRAIAAGVPDGPFTGVPFLMKDLTASIAGVPMAPGLGEGLGGCSLEHAVTLSVRVSAALLDATSGPGAGDPYVAPAPARPFRQEVGAEPGALRIAFTSLAPNGAKVEADSLRTLTETVKLCAGWVIGSRKRIRRLTGPRSSRHSSRSPPRIRS